MATKQTRLTPFGRKVRKRLIDKNMTQVELAALLGWIMLSRSLM